MKAATVVKNVIGIGSAIAAFIAGHRGEAEMALVFASLTFLWLLSLVLAGALGLRRHIVEYRALKGRISDLDDQNSALHRRCKAESRSREESNLELSRHKEQLQEARRRLARVDHIAVVEPDRDRANVALGRKSGAAPAGLQVLDFFDNTLMKAEKRICAAGVSLPLVRELAEADSELRKFARHLKTTRALKVKLIITNPLSPILTIRRGSRYTGKRNPATLEAANTLLHVYQWMRRFRFESSSLTIRIVNSMLPYGLLLVDDRLTWNPTGVSTPGEQMPGIIQPVQSKMGGALFNDFNSLWDDSGRCFSIDGAPTTDKLLEILDKDPTIKPPASHRIITVKGLLEAKTSQIT